ncbi:hypothetical protein [Rubinisphaera sp.]|uniref:hypothetical protein n=1 Tax=Rubinisphaera sp. TaxID=2024857 RepID=UPI000C0CF446|nr:hypothetical protein [Rubinisphaera sp.]MBV10328.1 hypothetical protein [Rubinisphaera sp.]HCS51098.1 hypothetical protein [Planctomycetaceae bacterium]|tara:strand:- start:1228 stop:1587 length:360 start_codon:yes stop_codon:yes gene_type:complete
MMKTTAGAVFDDGETFDSTVDPFDAVHIDYDMMTSLPYGWEPFQLRTDQPTTTYEIARTADMLYNVAAGDSSNYNHASGRLDYQGYDPAIDVERADFEAYELDVILHAWFDELTLTNHE